MIAERLLSSREVMSRLSYSKSTLRKRVINGLLTPQVKVGDRKNAWPESEINAIVAARVRGCDDNVIRELVKQLIQIRANATAA